jgi:D-lactate dehydrogenase
MSKANNMVKLGNFAAAIVGHKTLQGITKLGHGLIKQIPVYLDSMPKAQGYNLDGSETNNNDVLLVPACPNRIFGADADYGGYPSKLILERMDYKVSFLADAKTSCCGQMYHSMCNTQQQEKMVVDLEKRVAGAKFAIIDNSSCSGFAKDAGIDTLDINQFIVEHVDKAKIKKKYKKIALHIDCSTAKHFFSEDYMTILRLCSDEVIIPEGINCCGFAGDKGFNLPELNASSLSLLAEQIDGSELGVTFNRTCQIGLTHHGKVPYISFVELMLNCMAG